MEEFGAVIGNSWIYDHLSNSPVRLNVAAATTKCQISLSGCVIFKDGSEDITFNVGLHLMERGGSLITALTEL